MSTKNKKFKLPYWIYPGVWGLRGKLREEAKILIEEDDPEKRDVRLAYLYLGEDEKALKIKLLEIEKKYNKISEFDFELKKLDLLFEDKNSKEYKEKLLDLSFKYKHISENEYEKEKATLRGEPYIKFYSENFKIDEKGGSTKIEISFDWNSLFIDLLRESGYKGYSEEEIVEKWFNDIIINNLNDDDFEKFTILREKEKRENRDNQKNPIRSSLKILRDENTTEYR